MLKTAEEVKRGLECCNLDQCKECPYETVWCSYDLRRDALDLIRQLEEALDMSFEVLRIVNKDADEWESSTKGGRSL